MTEIFEAFVRPWDVDGKDEDRLIGYFGTWTEARNAGNDWVAQSQQPHSGQECKCRWELVIVGHLLGAIAPLF